MIAEIWLYATAESRPELRRLGLVGDAVALWSRAVRCRKTWAPHEERCHRAIGRAIAGLSRTDTVLVLGSGLLRDVALDALLRRFRRVILIGAVHLWPARRASRHEKVSRRVADLSGYAGLLGGTLTERADPLNAERADRRVDLVISANVLSQMPMAFARRLPSGRGPPDLGRRIVAAHLADLAGFSARVCLLTDIAHREIGRGGDVRDETDLLHGESLPTPDDAWDWEVAPRGEISRGAAHTHRVHAYLDLAAARAR